MAASEYIIVRLFWKSVDVRSPSECWPWKGLLDKHGYGRLRIGSKSALAHRVAHELGNAPIQEGDPARLVLHSCDNPACCNPAHLRAGTPRENVHDMVSRGRLVAIPPREATKVRIDGVEYQSVMEAVRRTGKSRTHIRWGMKTGKYK